MMRRRLRTPCPPSILQSHPLTLTIFLFTHTNDAHWIVREHFNVVDDDITGIQALVDVERARFRGGVAIRRAPRRSCLPSLTDGHRRKHDFKRARNVACFICEHGATRYAACARRIQLEIFSSRDAVIY